MSNVLDMRCRIHRLEDNLLRCKNFNEQIRMSRVLVGYRKHLNELILEEQKKQLIGE